MRNDLSHVTIWFIIFFIGIFTQGVPSSNQMVQTFFVAIFSVVIFLRNSHCEA
ncbi:MULTISPECIES: multidrug resistance efflux transporter family protein [Staphylococcus]|uniref:multidrug resistance efflux transporter family protein n=1 Tax=Staphylococcus TaxID=1279 RepID=UPI00338DA18A